MLNLLLLPFIILFFLFITAVSLIWRIVSRIFNPKGRQQQNNNNRRSRTYSRSRRNSSVNTEDMPKREKVFGDDEGEYVDFKEIE